MSRNLWLSCGAYVNGVFTTGQCSGVQLEILGHSASNGNLLPDQDGPPTSDDFVQMKVSFTTAQPNTMVGIWVGAHLAKEFYWNYVSDPAFQAKGAATAAGASFHVRLITWDENRDIGNRDNQMQAGAVVTPATKTGYKWNDANANGTKETNEAFLSGWKIYVDYNNNGFLDSGLEPYAVTDTNGFYQINLITGQHPPRHLRRVQGILRLAKRHPFTSEALDHACQRALTFHKKRLAYIKDCALYFVRHGQRPRLVAPQRKPDTLHLHHVAAADLQASLPSLEEEIL